MAALAHAHRAVGWTASADFLNRKNGSVPQKALGTCRDKFVEYRLKISLGLLKLYYKLDNEASNQHPENTFILELNLAKRHLTLVQTTSEHPLTSYAPEEKPEKRSPDRNRSIH